MHWQLKAISFALAGTLLMVTGCGQSTYDARMAGAPAVIKKRLDAGDSKLLTKEFFPITDADRVKQGVKFQLPALFAGDAVKNVPVDAPNAKVAQADIPGFCYSLQTTLADDTGKQLPAYCYFYSIKKQMTSRQQVEDLIKVGLSALQAEAAWQPVSKPGAPPGSMISVAGTFDFDVNGMNEHLPGTLAIHLFETDENVVLVGWRYETKSEQKNNLAAAITKAMGTAVLDKDAAAPPPTPAPGK